MKKIILVVSMLVAAVMAFTLVSPALAAGSQQGGPGNGHPDGWGRSDSPRQYMRGDGDRLNLDLNIQMDGILEDIIHQNLADALGMSLDEFERLIDEGQTLAEIAVSQGFDLTEIRELMVQARADALAEAVDQGSLSQDQADWLASRGFGFSIGLNRNNCLIDLTAQRSIEKHFSGGLLIPAGLLLFTAVPEPQHDPSRGFSSNHTRSCS